MDNKRTPRKEDGMDLFMRALSTGDPSSAIMGQEADGQKSFVGSDTLPTDMRGDSKAVLEAAGVMFLGVVKEDPMFQYVELPKGWKKVPTGHSMWFDLVDDKNRKRAGIFYKAAFYDRSSFLGVNRRYNFTIDYTALEDDHEAIALVTDGNQTIYRTDPVASENDNDGYEASDKARDLAKAWLDKHYPRWEDASAYWD